MPEPMPCSKCGSYHSPGVPCEEVIKSNSNEEKPEKGLSLVEQINQLNKDIEIKKQKDSDDKIKKVESLFENDSELRKREKEISEEITKAENSISNLRGLAESGELTPEQIAILDNIEKEILAKRAELDEIHEKEKEINEDPDAHERLVDEAKIHDKEFTEQPEKDRQDFYKELDTVFEGFIKEYGELSKERGKLDSETHDLFRRLGNFNYQEGIPPPLSYSEKRLVNRLATRDKNESSKFGDKINESLKFKYNEEELKAEELKYGYDLALLGCYQRIDSTLRSVSSFTESLSSLEHPFLKSKLKKIKNSELVKDFIEFVSKIEELRRSAEQNERKMGELSYRIHLKAGELYKKGKEVHQSKGSKSPLNFNSKTIPKRIEESFKEIKGYNPPDDSPDRKKMSDAFRPFLNLNKDISNNFH